MLVTILLDWGEVFRWPGLLRQWVRVLRGMGERVGEEVGGVMGEVMAGWRGRGVQGQLEGEGELR